MRFRHSHESIPHIFCNNSLHCEICSSNSINIPLFILHFRSFIEVIKCKNEYQAYEYTNASCKQCFSSFSGHISSILLTEVLNIEYRILAIYAVWKRSHNTFTFLVNVWFEVECLLAMLLANTILLKIRFELLILNELIALFHQLIFNVVPAVWLFSGLTWNKPITIQFGNLSFFACKS